jgi:hypothetical protein
MKTKIFLKKSNLELGICWELEGEPPEGKREDLSLRFEYTGPGGSEGLIDLLDCGRHVRTVK